MASESKGTTKRDTLRKIEREVQEKWAKEGAFENNAPIDESEFLAKDKFMATFPYPYMNGKLHLGHAFTASKAEFAVAFQSMRGKRALWPFGFHCTGMPIKAASDKLRGEIAKYGCPPVFPVEDESTGPAVTAVAAKHSKVTAKSGKAKSQWEIMEQSGIPTEEIPRFVDPKYWMDYFPPIAQQDLTDLGCHIDWRRSFITTDVNPYYDAFVRWQFNKLKSQGKVKFGKRYTIYSPLDGQPCLDHDRSSGETVEPKEYTIIKLQVIALPEGDSTKFTVLRAYDRVYLGAATLRPETMSGQTNCWVGPEITYTAYQLATTNSQSQSKDVIICTARSALNMAYQDILAVDEQHKPIPLASFTGSDLFVLSLQAPLTPDPPRPIPILPMFSVSAEMGTGIVTSVPSNAPMDYVALRDLQEKEALRRKFNLDDATILSLTPIPIILSPTYGNLSAVSIVNQMNIKSQNDAVNLETAKEIIYKDDFYAGTMLVGPMQGETVSKAKVMIRDLLISQGRAFIYYEPEKPVISRSMDLCVVALTDQWYLDYGEEHWRRQAEDCLQKMETYSSDVKNSFQATLGWMKQWACSRSFGLGSRLPWDPIYLIESLSDSTIYMAYYTIAHFLQYPGQLDGGGIAKAGSSEVIAGPMGITVAQMTDTVWDWIFGTDQSSGFTLQEISSQSGINSETLTAMRREFRYWYPFDVRVSGKDLVPNHLTFSIYNHVALFPEEFWPKGMRANGHLLLNSEKMSKSSGNFMTIRDAIQDFGADATRLALADAGDSVEDANFLKDTANNNVLRLFNLVEFYWEMRHYQANNSSFRHAGSADSAGVTFTWQDKVFFAEMNAAITATFIHYETTNYREALRTGWYELQNARDRYRDATVLHGDKGMSWLVIERFLRVQALLILPFAPHFAEYVWSEYIVCSPASASATAAVSALATVSSIRQERFPTVDLTPLEGVDGEVYLAASRYLQDISHTLRTSLTNELKPKKGKKPTGGCLDGPPNTVQIYLATAYPRWQEEAIATLFSFYTKDSHCFTAVDDVIAKALKEKMALFPHKKFIPFAMDLKQRVLATTTSTEGGAFERRLLFQEMEVLKENYDFLKRTLGSGIDMIELVPVDVNNQAATTSDYEVKNKTIAEQALPQVPTLYFYRK